jgi:hypothetical protein
MTQITESGRYWPRRSSDTPARSRASRAATTTPATAAPRRSRPPAASSAATDSPEPGTVSSTAPCTWSRSARSAPTAQAESSISANSAKPRHRPRPGGRSNAGCATPSTTTSFKIIRRLRDLQRRYVCAAPRSVRPARGASSSSPRVTCPRAARPPRQALQNTRVDEGVRAACELLLDLLAQRHHGGTGGTGDQALPHNASQHGNVLPTLGRAVPFGAPLGEPPGRGGTRGSARAGARELVLAVVRSASLRAGETSAATGASAAADVLAPGAVRCGVAVDDGSTRPCGWGSLTCPPSRVGFRYALTLLVTAVHGVGQQGLRSTRRDRWRGVRRPQLRVGPTDRSGLGVWVRRADAPPADRCRSARRRTRRATLGDRHRTGTSNG